MLLHGVAIAGETPYSDRVDGREKAVFDSIVTNATVELFASTGMAIVPSTTTPSLDRVAVIGFGGGGLRGALGLGLSNALLEKLGQPQPDDWLSEMSNQLLGRIKNRLMRHGATIGITLPMVLRGLRVELVGASKELWAYPFEGPGGALCVWLDVLADAKFVLGPASDEGLDIPSEGELILF